MSLPRAAFTCLLLFALLTLPVTLGRPIPGDIEILRAAIGLRHEALTFAIGLLTFVSSAAVTAAIMAAFTFFEWRRERSSRALWAMLAYAGAVANNIALRILIGRLPPDVDYLLTLLPEIHASFHRFSYPSGHAGTALIAFLVLATKTWPSRQRRWPGIIIATLLILGVGFGRFYLGVHWPSDVLAGYLLAGFWFCLGLAIRRGYNLPSI